MRRHWALLSIVAAMMIAGGVALDRRSAARESTVSPPVFTDDEASASARIMSSAQRPNIVFVMVDDLDTELIDHMPVLQTMLRERGATFSNYFVTSALCCPSRSSFMRGQFPHNTTVLTNEDGFSKFHQLGLEASTVATWLQSSGYRTALMGKYLNGYLQAPGTGFFDYVPPGWSEWDVAGDGFFEFDYTLNHNGKLEQYGHAPQDFLTDLITKRASDFIAGSAAAGKPFYLELAPFAPHYPYTSPPRYAKLFNGVQAPRPPSFNTIGTGEPKWLAALPRLNQLQINDVDQAYRQRLQAVQGIDATLGSIIDTLVRVNQLDNTYIVFTSDNGYHMGQHRLPPGKQTAFDSDIRVPLLVRGPGVEPRQIDSITLNIDLAPTFATWAGVTPPNFVDGRPLQSVLADRTPTNWRNVALIEHTGPPTLPGDPDYQAQDNPTSYAALRTDRYTYVSYTDGEVELYDHQTDPNEMTNIARQADGSLLASLQSRLSALRSCKAQACRDTDAS